MLVRVDPPRRRAVRHRAAAPSVAAAAAGAARRAAGRRCGRARRRPGEQRRRRAALGARPTATWRCSARSGQGTTTALIWRCRRGVCDACEPDERHVYVVDARGDERLDALGGSRTAPASCGPHERERLARLLDGSSASSTGDAPAAAGDGRPEIVLAVDGIPALRATLDGPDRRDALGAAAAGRHRGRGGRHRLRADGRAPGAVPGRRAGRVRRALDLPPRRPRRGGVPAACRPAAVPGADPRPPRRRVDRLRGAARHAVPTRRRRRRRGAGGPAPIGVLPAIVDAATMPAGRSTAAGELELAVGLDFETLDGRPGSRCPTASTCSSPDRRAADGRTALRRLAASWLDARPGEHGRVGRVARRPPLPPLPDAASRRTAAPSPPSRRPAGRPCLLVVDDAERVDDSGGASPRSSPSGGPASLVVAAGRPDGAPRAVRALDVRRPPQPPRPAARGVRRHRRRRARRAAAAPPAAAGPARVWRGWSAAVDGRSSQLAIAQCRRGGRRAQSR